MASLRYDELVNTSLETLYSDANSSIFLLGNGISAVPAMNYLVQSLFLRATGFQEQKIKCIIWDFATYDESFRFASTFGNNPLISRGMSSIRDKNEVFQKILEINLQNDKSNFIGRSAYRQNIVRKSIDSVISCFKDSPLKEVNIRSYNNVLSKNYNASEIVKVKGNNGVAIRSVNLMSGSLASRFESMYDARNKIAHNAYALDEVNVDLRRLRNSKNGGLKDYFDWFVLLSILDNLFIDQYNEFKNYINKTLNY